MDKQVWNNYMVKYYTAVKMNQLQYIHDMDDLKGINLNKRRKL